MFPIEGVRLLLACSGAALILAVGWIAGRALYRKSGELHRGRILPLSAMKPFSDKQGLMPFYWRTVVKPNFWQALMISLLILLGAVLEMIPVGLTVPLLNSLMNPDKAFQGKLLSAMSEALRRAGILSGANTILFALLVLVCVLFVVRAALSVLQNYWLATIAHKLRREAKVSLLEKSLRAQYEYQAKKGRGAVITDIDHPADSIGSAINTLGGLFTGIFNALALAGFMIYLSWWVSLVIFILAVGGVQGLRRIVDRRAYACGRAIYELQRDMTSTELDSIDGLKVVKAYVLESQMVQRQRSLLATELLPILRLTVLRQVPSLANEVGASLVVLVLGAATFLAPSIGMDFPTLVAFLIALRRVSPAIAGINNASGKLNELRRHIEIIEEVLDFTPQETQGGRVVDRIEEIRFNGVSFKYASRPEQWALRHVDLIMRRGSMTALVGPTGAGKSTVANLLVGLYTPVLGSIFLNGLPLQQFNLASWRGKIGFVCQDTFLFNTTLRENIALWDDTVSQAEVEWAARVAHLHDFVAALPDGYDTIVGDRGLRLSGGQCQRVAIARAIVRHPEVLILDEATNALDNVTEAAVYAAINTLRDGAIVIVIAHRLTTIKDADQIIVLGAGRVAETGTHDFLIKARGSYAKLYEGEASEREVSLL